MLLDQQVRQAKPVKLDLVAILEQLDRRARLVLLAYLDLPALRGKLEQLVKQEQQEQLEQLEQLV